MDIEFRNPVSTADGNIDMEINHPEFGWIPFTASPNDTEQLGVDLYNAATEKGNIASYTPPQITGNDIDAERDRRIVDGFVFGGVKYQSRPEDRENISGASQVALEAIMNGAQPGDLYWHGGSTPFVWIASDNSLNPMDAQTMFNFGKAAMSHKQTLIFKARAIKDMNPIPADYATNETYWS